MSAGFQSVAAELRRLAGVLACVALGVGSANAQDAAAGRLRDRGEGQPADMFGTYIRRGELLVYPFYESYRDKDYEYKPEELGYAGAQDFRGRYRAHEGLIYLGYGLSDRVALELEIAAISATLWKSPDDPSGVPAQLTESGLGDTSAKVRWRWNKETDRRPEFFSFFETGFPLQHDRALIGTQNWEFAFGTGVVRGFTWGTLTARATLRHESGQLEPGEFAVEYPEAAVGSISRLRRHRRHARRGGADHRSAGVPDTERVPETQQRLRPHVKGPGLGA